MKYKKANNRALKRTKEEKEKWDRKIPDMYKRDDSPEQNGEDF